MLFIQNCFKRIFLTAGKYSDFSAKAETRQKSASVIEGPSSSNSLTSSTAAVQGSNNSTKSSSLSVTQPHKMSQSFDAASASKDADKSSSIASQQQKSATFKPAAFHIQHAQQNEQSTAEQSNGTSPVKSPVLHTDDNNAKSTTVSTSMGASAAGASSTKPASLVSQRLSAFSAQFLEMM
jgi:hypothetical protein